MRTTATSTLWTRSWNSTNDWFRRRRTRWPTLRSSWASDPVQTKALKNRLFGRFSFIPKSYLIIRDEDIIILYNDFVIHEVYKSEATRFVEYVHLFRIIYTNGQVGNLR